MDVEDGGDTYNFIADVPGLEKGDIKVSSSNFFSDVLSANIMIVLQGNSCRWYALRLKWLAP